MSVGRGRTTLTSSSALVRYKRRQDGTQRARNFRVDGAAGSPVTSLTIFFENHLSSFPQARVHREFVLDVAGVGCLCGDPSWSRIGQTVRVRLKDRRREREETEMNFRGVIVVVGRRSFPQDTKVEEGELGLLNPQPLKFEAKRLEQSLYNPRLYVSTKKGLKGRPRPRSTVFPCSDELTF